LGSLRAFPDAARRRAHALGETLTLELARRVGHRGAIGRRSFRVGSQAARRLAQRVDAIRELFLLRREPAPGVARAAALAIELLGLVRDAALGLRQLLRLELQLAERAPPRVRRRALHLALEVPQLAGGLLAARAGGRRVLAAEI